MSFETLKNPYTGRLSEGELSATIVSTGDARYGLRMETNPLGTSYGAVGNGTTDDGPAINAALTAGGERAVVGLKQLTFYVSAASAPLILDGNERLFGMGTKGTIIKTDGDYTAIRIVGGQGQEVSDLKILNTYAGVRTTYDIEVINPTKPVLRDVEVDLPNGSSGAGGIIFRYDAGQPGSNSFMPELSRVWVRNGHLVANAVTDGKVSDSFVWAPYTGALGAIQILNGASSWTFLNCDVVPPIGDFAGYHVANSENISIKGGLVDGSYADLMTGWGVRAVAASRLSVSTMFYNLGRGAIDLDGVKASAFVGNVITRCNKADNFWSDIRVNNSRYNTFIGNTHSALAARTNKGAIYVETGESSDNVIDMNTMESNEGAHYYAAASVVTLGRTIVGRNNRPVSGFAQSFTSTVSATSEISVEVIYKDRSLLATGDITLTLPLTAAVYSGSRLPIKNIGTGVITIIPQGGDTIDAAITSMRLMPNESLQLISSVGRWNVQSGTGVAPSHVVPPACVLAAPAAGAWMGVNSALFHRFSIERGGFYRYVNFRLDVASGNYQLAVVRLSGTGLTDYTRVMSTGVVTTPTAGDKTIDLGSTYLDPGHYALVLWFDNVTAQVRQAGSSGLTASRLTALVASLASGVPSTGTLAWGSTQFCMGLVLAAP